MIKKIVLATDHAGFELKEYVKNMLSVKGIEIKDFGAFTYNAQDDYPDFILPAAQYIADNNLIGIIFGGSGQGEAIAANRIIFGPGTNIPRAAEEIIQLSKLHNNANVLSVGARFVDQSRAEEIIDLWLSTSFEEGRHQRRIEKLDS